MALSREAFLQAATIPTEEVSIPELGGSVRVRGMSARDRSKFEKQFQTASGKPDKSKQLEIRERLVVACCIDDEGKPLFTVDDVAAIGAQRADIVERIVNVAQKLCGMTNADVEDLAKNSGLTDEDS